MQFESQSHRGFSPVVSSMTRQGKPFKRFLIGPWASAHTALKRRCEWEPKQTASAPNWSIAPGFAV